MIHVDEAKKIIAEHSLPLPATLVPLSEAAGLVLAEDVIASVNVPAYPQSSMDGYAFAFHDLASGSTLVVTGEMAAGAGSTIQLQPGQATRIFTGAPLPTGADTVIMQEKTTVEDSILHIYDHQITPGLHVRAMGSEIVKGALALQKMTVLSPAAIGFLASIGTAFVEVLPLPAITIIVTGNELQEVGKPLQPGQVYESNSLSLLAATRQLHRGPIQVLKAADQLDVVQSALSIALNSSDVVLVTGGVSVGDYDFVAEAAERAGITSVFHKIRQRPGKPFFFGIKDRKLVFGLPGNPASVLSCFYQYIEPSLKKMSGLPSQIRIIRAPIAETFRKPAGLTHFLKGFFDGQKVTALHAQESFRLSSFAQANCLVRINEEVTVCDKGQTVEVHILPV